jgi:hypothetical protein
MNRAWIPAGALAGVSVAGLLALGPLTDSMGTQVAFPDPVTIPKTAVDEFRPVSVTASIGTVGSVRTIKSQGGRQQTGSNSSEGLVGFRRSAAPSTAPASTRAPVSTTNTTKPKKVKKTVKRQGSIGTPGETNSSAGLATGDPSGQRADGEQASNLTGDGN